MSATWVYKTSFSWTVFHFFTPCFPDSTGMSSLCICPFDRQTNAQTHTHDVKTGTMSIDAGCNYRYLKKKLKHIRLFEHGVKPTIPLFIVIFLHSTRFSCIVYMYDFIDGNEK